MYMFEGVAYHFEGVEKVRRRINILSGGSGDILDESFSDFTNRFQEFLEEVPKKYRSSARLVITQSDDEMWREVFIFIEYERYETPGEQAGRVERDRREAERAAERNRKEYERLKTRVTAPTLNT